MGLASLLAGQVADGGAYLLGTPAELTALFGSPAPRLPAGDCDEAGVERIAVEIGPHLREAFARWLSPALASLSLGPSAGMPTAGSPAEIAERDYLELLEATLREVYAVDRRQGLVNVFWLAHSREIVDELDRQTSAPGGAPALRYRVHPLLEGLLKRGIDASRAATGGRAQQRLLLEFRRGAAESDALVRSIVEDQLTLTEKDPRDFDAARVLVPENSRFRISAAAFEEILRILRERLAQAAARNERWARTALAASCPGGGPVPSDPRRDWERAVFADGVREALLRDLDGAGEQLLRSRALRREVPREGSLCELLEGFAEVTRCLRRAEAVWALRRALSVTSRSLDHAGTRERFLEGRLYRFATASAVQSGVRTATILFADIRGFTRASEGPVSEGDLARELYEIFDPAALIVRRFGGTVATYLGDGFMATFGVGAQPAEEALAAVRTAIALQQVLGRLRRQGRTTFRMGISLHSGRVSVARFFRDEHDVQTTLIGRQVNIAGRLSSSAPLPEGAALAGGRSVGEVCVDAHGRLVNQGIAVSGSLVEALREHVPCESFTDGGVEGVRWYDPDLCLWLHFGYAGEARFRGLAASVPIYSLVAAAPAAGAAG